MKKVLLFLLTALMIMSSVTIYGDDMSESAIQDTKAEVEPYNIIYGDVNDDKLVDAEDALLILKKAAKISELGYWGEVAADVNGSGVINAKDALYILKKAAKLMDLFPIEDPDVPNETEAPVPTATPVPTEVPVVDKEYIIDLGNGKTTTVVGHLDNEAADKVIELLNQYRKENGLYALKKTDELMNCATIRSYEIAYYFEHARPCGMKWTDILNLGTKYKKSRENIAYGQISPEQVMKSWRESDLHNKSMLNQDCDQIGVGVFAKRIDRGNGTYKYEYYWVQVFLKEFD